MQRRVMVRGTRWEERGAGITRGGKRASRMYGYRTEKRGRRIEVQGPRRGKWSGFTRHEEIRDKISNVTVVTSRGAKSIKNFKNTKTCKIYTIF